MASVPDDGVPTLVAVQTEEGSTGIGSVFTSDHLVRGALKLLEPLLLGEHALEPERVTEKLPQHTFWQRRGGSVTHTISGIDIALRDLLGQATKQPVGRLLGGRYRERVQPCASVLMEEPGPLAERLRSIKAQGFRAFQIAWGQFGGRKRRSGHFPPATSQWNKIEHRMFCHIPQNWRGRPLVSQEVVVPRIGPRRPRRVCASEPSSTRRAVH